MTPKDIEALFAINYFSNPLNRKKNKTTGYRHELDTNEHEIIELAPETDVEETDTADLRLVSDSEDDDDCQTENFDKNCAENRDESCDNNCSEKCSEEKNIEGDTDCQDENCDKFDVPLYPPLPKRIARELASGTRGPTPREEAECGWCGWKPPNNKSYEHYE